MDHSPQRRKFLGTLATVIDATLALAVAVPGLRFLSQPLRRKRADRDFLRVSPLDGVPDGRPVRVVIAADRHDAYVHYPPGPIGQVWLLKDANEAGSNEPRIRCWQTICPHLGCGIDFAADRNVFSCPCHATEFDHRGRRKFGPSPRDMDELECRISPPDEAGRRWVEVRYQEYRTGNGKKTVIG